MSFRCPVCQATVFERLTLAGDDGAPYLSRLYACAGCTIVFADPRRLSAPQARIPGQPVASPDFRRVHSPGKGGPGRPRALRRGSRSRGADRPRSDGT